MKTLNHSHAPTALTPIPEGFLPSVLVHDDAAKELSLRNASQRGRRFAPSIQVLAALLHGCGVADAPSDGGDPQVPPLIQAAEL